MLAFGLTAWLVAAIEREVPDAADAMLTVAAGGPGAAWRGRLVAAGLAAALVIVVFIAYPLVFGSFDPRPGAGDVEGAVLLHVVSSCAGGALALLLARPVRPATAAATIFAVLIALIALGGPLGAAAGPGGAAQAYADADGISGRLLLAVAVTVVEAAALTLAARRAARYRG